MTILWPLPNQGFHGRSSSSSVHGLTGLTVILRRFSESKKGYKYFGASKDLPGVRELFEPDPPKPLKKTRAEYMR